jgi:hypothetical protein
MKKLGWMVALVVVAVACGSGADMMGEIMDSGVPDAGAQPGTEGTFVGYSSERLSLSRGLFAVYAACQADFGASSRICTEAEVLGTLNLPGLPSLDPNSSNGSAWAVETLAVAPSCFRSVSGSSGTYLGTNGLWASAPCHHERVLACCTVN